MAWTSLALAAVLRSALAATAQAAFYAILTGEQQTKYNGSAGFTNTHTAPAR